jgi:hypothetical protein
MESRFVRCVATLVVLLSMSCLLWGQVDRGSITGTVTDATGAVIPGAEVRASNVDTGVETAAITNDVGIYRLLNVPVGTYRVLVSMPGFKTYERTDFRLAVAQTALLNVSLQVGEMSDTITISANSELLNAANPLVATTMQSHIITDLPLSFSGGRAVESFAYAVTPAVEGNNWTSFMAGGQSFSKEVLIDGVSATSHIQGHIGESSPTMEAVEEFKVQTGGMSAEYGRTSGGVFNFALKSGTNRFSGSVFYYARNEALNANTWMNNWNLARNPDDPRFKRAVDRQHVYGTSAGGPVVIPGVYNGRDRTFVFGAYEKYEQERLVLGPLNRTVPIPEFLDGDFSKLLTGVQVGTDALGRPVFAGQIFDPATMRRTPEGQWVSDPFPGNLIPRERISQVSSRIIDIYRASYRPMAPDRLINNSATTQYNDPWFHQSQLTMKADHAFSENNKLSGSFIWTQRPRVLREGGGIWDPLAGETGGPLAMSRLQEVGSRRVTVSDGWTIRPNLINTLTLTYNRYRNPSTAMSEGGDWPQKLGLTGTSASQFPSIGFGSAVNGIGTNQIGYNKYDDGIGATFVVSEAINWIRGSHSLKFGGEFWHMMFNSYPTIGDNLGFGFSNVTTGIPGMGFSNRIGFGFASFLLGEVNSASRWVPSSFYTRRNYGALYLQDDFRVSRNLTLNLGIRWEQTRPLVEKNNRWSNFNPDIMNKTLGVPGALEFASPEKRSFEGKPEWTSFSPRLGFAYRLTDRAVLRSSYGIFYSPISMQYWFGIPYGNFGAKGFVGVDNMGTTGNIPRFGWDNGYPGNYVAPTQNPDYLEWGMVAIDENALKPGYTQNYDMSVQYSFTSNDMLEVTFMGNDGRRLHDGGLRRNQPQRSVWEDPKMNPQAWIWDEASAQAAGVPFPYAGFEGQAGFAITPFPQVANTWGPLYYVESPLGSSSYRSLQFAYTRRLSAGMGANVSYNFSKAKGNSETGFQETWSATGASDWYRYAPGVQDVHNLKEAADTVTSFDQTHIFKGVATYELPFGRNRKWMVGGNPVVDAILGGWNTSLIFRYSTGFPLGIATNVWYPGWPGAVYADVAPNADFSIKWDKKGFDPGNPASAGNMYFDPSIFSNPTNNKLGNGKRVYDELRSFGGVKEDIGIMKYWGLGEAARLQFRVELLNAFNRHTFEDPIISLGNTAGFGKVMSAAGAPRTVQLGLRINW